MKHGYNDARLSVSIATFEISSQAQKEQPPVFW